MFLEEEGSSSARNARIIKHYCIIFHYDNIITPRVYYLEWTKYLLCHKLEVPTF